MTFHIHTEETFTGKIHTPQQTCEDQVLVLVSRVRRRASSNARPLFPSYTWRPNSGFRVLWLICFDGLHVG